MFSDYSNPKSIRQILTQKQEPSDALVADFEKVARLEVVRRGDAVVRQGEVCDYFVFLHRGLMRVCNTTNGVDDTILFGTSGDVFTSLHSYYAGEPAVFSLIAVEDSEVWIVNYDDMRKLLACHQDLLVWMLDLVIEQIYVFEKRYIFFTNKSAEERFRNFMLDRYGEVPSASIKHISAIVPLKHIAQYLKITQSTLSRLRKKYVGKM